VALNRLAWPLPFALLLTACPPQNNTAATADAGTATAATSATVAALDAGLDGAIRPPMPHGKRALSPCRGISVIGDVAWGDGSEKVADGAPLPARLFLTLPEKSSFTARDPRSARETRFSGPGFVRPCVDEQERSDLVSGVFLSTPGSGEQAGHEEWVVTGVAVVRYSAAAVEVRAEGLNGKVEIRPRGGEAFVWASPYAGLTPAPKNAGPAGAWVALSPSAGEAYRISARAPGTPGAPTAPSGFPAPDDSFTADCVARAAVATSDADHLRDAGTGFGAAAGAHVEALKEARAACAIADLRAAYGYASAGDGGVADSAHRAAVAIDAALQRAKIGTPR
jgi:hypothetical protein